MNKDWHVRLTEEQYHKMSVVAEYLFNDTGKSGREARAFKRILDESGIIEEKYQSALVAKELKEKFTEVKEEVVE